MPLTEEEQQWLAQTVGGTATPQPTTASDPFGIPPGAPYPVSTQIGRTRLAIPPPPAEVQRQQELAQSKAVLAEESATRRQLLKKAADQKLQLEQGISLFNKIFDEADTDIPVIEHPERALPIQRIGRFAGRELGLRERQRGTLSSLRARATPSLKSLGEVGVLTNQDIDRILKGGFPADDDSDISRTQKRIGLITDLQMKLDAVNTTLGTSGTRQADRGTQTVGAVDPYLAEARRRGLLK